MRKLIFFFFLSFVSASGQVVDGNYGTSGKLFVNIPPTQNREYNIKTFYTADQKTVNIGYYDTGSFTTKTYFITKYNYDGTPDATFGTNGLLSIPAYPNNPGEIMVQGSVTLDDNSIILSCSANMKAYLVKITGNGSIDTSFGDNGFKLADFLFTPTTLTYGNLMKDEANQIFVVYSATVGNPSKTYTKLCKILPSGTIDTSFGNNGFSSILIDRDYKFQTLKQTRIKNGKIYNFATSFYYNNSGIYTQTDVWTCHFLNGTPDASFGDNGYVYVPRDITIYDYNIQEDGKILIANYVNVSSANSYVRGSRYLRSGAIDTSFGNSGKVEYGFGQWSVHIPHRIMEIDHHVYIFSSYYKSDSPVEYAATILKYNTNGVRDVSFGTNGLFKAPANISSVADVFLNGDNGFILTVQKNTYGDLFNMKVDYDMNFLSTESVVLTPQMKLFPNPVTDILYLSSVKNEDFVIYNAAGQKVKAGSYTAGKGIHVQDLSKGSYWLKLEHSKAVQFIKK
ncbi:T9SS type A sorting domain-containing protein [Chryseobacterium oranimense]|uniref:T9SS type A sorting domain-containing protein n=1 Tax=Chryseobacterium oranimense TaxID=421058 RepID=UPI0031E36647